MTPDISIVLNVHDETIYLQRTLLSLVEAASFAAAAGVTLELVMVLDSSPQETLDLARACAERMFLTYPYSRVHLEVVQNRSPGASRNDGVALACGEYVALCDADDLISFNFLLACLRTAREQRRPGIVFPQYVLEFGAREAIVRYLPLVVMTPMAMLHVHPYTARAFAPRTLFREIPFGNIPVSNGFAHEDWHFNCEVIAAGYDLTLAPDTLLFYRKRPGSVLDRAERVSTRQIPPSRLFLPQRYLELCRSSYEALRERGERDYPCPALSEHDSGRRLGELPFFQELLIAANSIDPAIDPDHYRHAPFWSPAHVSLRAGVVYYEACSRLNTGEYDDVFLLPFLVSGGAEKYLILLMEALRETGLSRHCLVICGEPTEKTAWLDRLPPDTDVIDLPKIDPDLCDNGCDIVTLKLIQAVAPKARIHLKTSPYVCRFYRKFRSVLADNRSYFYHFTDDRRVSGSRLVTDGYGFSFVSDCAADLAGIVSDHQRVIDEDRRRFGVWPEKWHCLPAPCEPAPVRARPGAVGSTGPLRLLWASRLDGQKRPELIAPIAHACAARSVPVEIDVYGTAILNVFDTAQLAAEPTVHYCGEFQDFFALPLRDYDALLYTSMFDGMPNVVLEAMSAGLAPVTVAIDGIPEVVRDGKTGLLIPNFANPDELVEAFVERIAVLHADCALRQRMSDACVELIGRERDRATFNANVRHIFGE